MRINIPLNIVPLYEIQESNTFKLAEYDIIGNRLYAQDEIYYKSTQRNNGYVLTCNMTRGYNQFKDPLIAVIDLGQNYRENLYCPRCMLRNIPSGTLEYIDDEIKCNSCGFKPLIEEV